MEDILKKNRLNNNESILNEIDYCYFREISFDDLGTFNEINMTLKNNKSFCRKLVNILKLLFY